jgi:dipeptidyl aminopeptidase/acylaminoacyl peptidase
VIRALRLGARAASVAWLAFAVGGVAPASAEEPAAPRALEIADYFRLRSVSGPQLSPDGKWVAYQVRDIDREEDESNTRIWMTPAEPGLDERQPIPMTAAGKSASRPRWSPDGKYLSFLASRDDGETQVWTLNRLGGEAHQLTEVEQGVSSYDWSPDGKRLVLVIKDDKDDDDDDSDSDSDSESDEEDAPEPWVITRRQFKTDYVGYLDSRRTHLYVFEVASRELRQITSGDYDDSQPAWSPDGTRIAFVSNRTDDPDANYNSDIWVVAADNTDEGETLLRITENPGADSSPAWSPDGESIAYLSINDADAIVYATQDLAVASATGGDERVLTGELDRWIYSPAFAADGRHVYFLLESGGIQSLARIRPGGGSVERVIDGQLAVDDFALPATAGNPLVAQMTKPDRPAELYLHDGGELERLTRENDELLAELNLGAVEKISYASADGTEIEAFVIKPPGFQPDFRYPTVLWIHGGPVSQYDARFNFQAQLFAANGYLVLLPNPRGSSGYGQDFSLAIWKGWGERDTEDVVAAVDWAIEKGWTDPERLGVGGWSYGGMLTNHVITKTDRFAGAITGASATLYVANYGHDQYQRWWEYELGLPWDPESRKVWEELSPFNRVEKIVTPTLIVCGEKDWNVPVINSEQLFMALKRLGRTAELVVYPGEYHGIGTPTFIQDRWERYLDWFDRYVKGGADDADDAPSG